ncbi:Beta-galactosidase C-terminal domain [Spirosoma fluviale]|uniref:Beta-galactosidase C-terminal domain n=1 Tax=Spirosoma fluviale TaxID=1597977 RepID=UPI000BE409CA|nr:Beta-galactosidase C-terminal domain [Spirosoma fluviale]
MYSNEQGKTVRYLFNYSAKPGKVTYPFANGRELLQGGTVTKNSVLDIAPWGVKIIEEQ